MHDDKFSVLPGETKIQYRKRIYELMNQINKETREKMVNGEINIVMDVDDFGFLMPGFDDLIRLKKSLPNLKITCFTIPLPIHFFGSNSKHFKKEKYKKWAEIVNSMDWIEVAVHGFYHYHHEFDVTYNKAITAIEATEALFKEIGLNYKKIFKAPYWQYSYDALVALRDKGYVVAIDRNHPRPIPEGLKTYIYNWSFEEPIPASDFIKGHGHFTGKNSNNISSCLHNILVQIPKDAKFISMSDYLKKHE